MATSFTRLGSPGTGECPDRFPSLAPWHAGPAILLLSALLWGVIYLSVVGLFG